MWWPHGDSVTTTASCNGSHISSSWSISDHSDFKVSSLRSCNLLCSRFRWLIPDIHFCLAEICHTPKTFIRYSKVRTCNYLCCHPSRLPCTHTKPGSNSCSISDSHSNSRRVLRSKSWEVRITPYDFSLVGILTSFDKYSSCSGQWSAVDGCTWPSPVCWRGRSQTLR